MTNESKASAKCVVIDTNVWRSETLLRTPIGVAILYAIRQGGAKLCIPEVIEREIRKQVLQAGIEADSRLVKSARLVQRILNSNSRPRVSPTSALSIKKAIDDRLRELAPITIGVPLTLSQVTRALDRVDAGLPPAGARRQQYKDCLIWEAARDTAKEYSVYILSQDAAFFDGQRLSKILARECREEGLFINAFKSPQDFLRELAPTPPSVDMPSLSQFVAGEVVPSAQELARLGGDFTLGDLVGLDIQVFATEDPGQVSATFEARYEISGVSRGRSQPVIDAILQVRGSFMFNLSSNRFIDFTGNRGNFFWRNSTGAMQLRGGATMAGGRTVLTLGPAIRAISGDSAFDFGDNDTGVLETD